MRAGSPHHLSPNADSLTRTAEQPAGVADGVISEPSEGQSAGCELLANPRARALVKICPPHRVHTMQSEEEDVAFVRQAVAELATSFTDPREHNIHAAFNGLLQAIEADRARIAALEAELAHLKPDTH